MDNVLTKQLNSMFKRNALLIQSQAKGVSHAESLLQPPYRGNCFNWVLGHLVSSRAVVLAKLGQPAAWRAQVARYNRGSHAVTSDATDVVDFVTMLSWLAESQKLLSNALKTLDPALLSQPHEADAGSTLGDWLLFLAWHETYHTGQTEQLRQLAGKNDSVID